jgi:hypothetical protein
MLRLELKRRVSNRKPLVPVMLGLLLAGGVAGCGVGSNPFDSSPSTVESRSVRVGTARSARVRVTMQPGNLTIRGNAHPLLDARFTYRPSSWRPALLYAVKSGRGDLIVSQPSLQSVKNGRNTWDLKLSNHVPIDLHVISGPGDAELNLRSLTLRTLSVAAGTGNMSIDAGSPSVRTVKVAAGPGSLSLNLVAPWKHSITATVDGSIGNSTLLVPSQTCAMVRVHSMGHVDAAEFTKRGEVYANSQCGRSKIAVRVSLAAGMANVVLKTDS